MYRIYILHDKILAKKQIKYGTFTHTHDEGETMETNGIIRRIDDLGRIVIPREYRKALGFDVGDPMEICARDNGEVLIRKVNTGGELVKFGKKLLSAAYAETGGTVGLCDGEKWLLCYGERGKELIGSNLGERCRSLMKSRESLVGDESECVIACAEKGAKAAFYPAISLGDCYGGVAISKIGLTACDEAIVRCAARALGELMAKY